MYENRLNCRRTDCSWIAIDIWGMSSSTIYDPASCWIPETERISYKWHDWREWQWQFWWRWWVRSWNHTNKNNSCCCCWACGWGHCFVVIVVRVVVANIHSRFIKYIGSGIHCDLVLYTSKINNRLNLVLLWKITLYLSLPRCGIAVMYYNDSLHTYWL